MTLIDLSGAAGTNVITATDGSVSLAALSDSGTPAELEINSDTSMTLTNVDIANRLDVNVDADDDGSKTLNAGALSAGTVTVDGSSDNETLNFNSTVTSTAAGITINSAATVNLGGTAQAATGLTILNVATEIDLAQDVNVTAQNGNVDLNTSVTLIDLSGAAGDERDHGDRWFGVVGSVER